MSCRTSMKGLRELRKTRTLVVEVDVDAGGLDVGGVEGVDDDTAPVDLFSYCSIAEYHSKLRWVSDKVNYGADGIY